MVFLGQKLFCCKNGRNISHLVHLDALITNPSFNFGVRCCLVSWGGKHPWGGDRQKQTNYTSSSTHLDADYESQIYFGIRWRLRGLGIFFTFVASHGARSVQFFLTVWDFSKMTPPVTPRRGTPTSSILFWKEDTLAVVLRKDGRDVTLPPPLVSPPFSNIFLVSTLYPWWPLFQTFSWCQHKAVFGYYITQLFWIIWKPPAHSPTPYDLGVSKVRRFPDFSISRTPIF